MLVFRIAANYLQTFKCQRLAYRRNYVYGLVCIHSVVGYQSQGIQNIQSLIYKELTSDDISRNNIIDQF